VSKVLKNRRYVKGTFAHEVYHSAGIRPLPGPIKARRLSPGISKHLGKRQEDGSPPLWFSRPHLSGVL